PLTLSYAHVSHLWMSLVVSRFFTNETAPTEIYTLSLHDALPICETAGSSARRTQRQPAGDRSGSGRELPRLRSVGPASGHRPLQDRKSTRLNSSHVKISYAVFCLKKKTKKNTMHAHWLLRLSRLA